jgi:outer membrane protein assembly factor BamB
MKTSSLLTVLSILVAGLLMAGCTGAAAPSSWPGVSVAGDTAYVAGGPQVQAVNVGNGNELFAFPTEPEASKSYYAAPGVTSDGNLIIGGFDHTVISLDPATRALNWTFSEPNDRIIAAPVVTEEQIFVASADHSLYAIDHNGGLIWKAAAGNDLWASPALADDQVYVGSMDHFLYAMDRQTGSEVWKTDLGASIVGTPALDETGNLYIGTLGKEMIAAETASGRILWRVPTQGSVWSGPAMREGVLYFGDLSGTIYALAAADGANVWQPIRPARSDDRLAGPIVASPLLEEDRLVFVAEASTVIALNYQGAIIWNQTINGTLYTTPVAVGDRYLIALARTDQLLAALDRNGNLIWTYPPAE